MHSHCKLRYKLCIFSKVSSVTMLPLIFVYTNLYSLFSNPIISNRKQRICETFPKYRRFGNLVQFEVQFGGLFKKNKRALYTCWIFCKESPLPFRLTLTNIPFHYSHIPRQHHRCSQFPLTANFRRTIMSSNPIARYIQQSDTMRELDIVVSLIKCCWDYFAKSHLQNSSQDSRKVSPLDESWVQNTLPHFAIWLTYRDIFLNTDVFRCLVNI